MKALFDFYGVTVEVRSELRQFDDVIQNLIEDFEYFLKPSDSVVIKGLRVQLQLVTHLTPKILLSARKVFKTKMCQVYDSGKFRICDYGNDTLVVSHTENGVRTLVTSGQLKHTAEIYEVAYLALLSAVGEELDLLGYHRVHALGVQNADKSTLVLLPSGGGKSATATLLLKSGFQVFSDEMPLVKNGTLYPFPIRIALHPQVAQALRIDLTGMRTFQRMVYPPKVLMPLKRHQIPRPGRLTFILSGRKGTSQAKITHDYPFRMMIHLFFGLVIGVGLCQMSEFMLRRGNFTRLLIISFSRFREMIILLFNSEKALFNVSSDANENAREMENFIVKTSAELEDNLSTVLRET